MEILTLEDQNNGGLVDFDMIDECDLPFLDFKTEMGLLLRQSVIDSNMDDDVMTGDELVEGAARMMHRSLEEAVNNHVRDRQKRGI